MMKRIGAVRLGAFVVLLAGLVALGKLHASVRGGYDLTASSRFGWILLFTLLAALVGYAFGFPEKPSLASPIRTAAVAAITPPILIALAQTMVGEFLLPRFFLLTSVPVTGAVLLCAFSIGRAVQSTSAARERVMLLCGADEASMVMTDVEFHMEIPCTIVGRFALDDSLASAAILDRCRALEPSLVVYSTEAAAASGVPRILTELHANGVRIRDVDQFYDAFVGKVPIRELESTALLFDVREVHHPSYFRISRMLDMAFGAIGVVVLGFLIPLVLLGNVFGNRGPLFYSQDRVGKGGEIFRILKFRSMLPGGATSQWTAEDDPRITRFGRLMRLTHIDELPQVLNILKGDLSLVGPRPEQPRYVDELSTQIPFYPARHLVRPGLTGWAQVNYPYGADEADAFEKLQYEFWYLRHQGLVLDLKIMLRTLRHVVGFGGR